MNKVHRSTMVCRSMSATRGAARTAPVILFEEETRLEEQHNEGRLSASDAKAVLEKRRQVREDMEVLGSDGGTVGRVKEVRTSDFLVNRTLARDIYVPYEAIARISGDTIGLNVLAEHVPDQGWAEPGMESVPEGGPLRGHKPTY
jgi:hypothetical protein